MHRYAVHSTETILGFVLYLILIYAFWARIPKIRGFRFNVINSYKRVNFFSVLGIFVLICIAYFDGDHFHYEQLVQENYGALFNWGHLEEFYFNLIQYVQGNWLYFRLIVWGGGFILYLLLLRRLGYWTQLGLYLFLMVFFTHFSMQRGSIGIVSAMLGLSFIIYPNRFKFLSWGLAFVLLYYSLELHKSIYVLLILMGISLFRTTKTVNYLIILGLFVLMFFLSDYFIEEALNQDFVGLSYLESESNIVGIGARINQILVCVSTYLYSFYLALNPSKNQSYQDSVLVRIALFSSSLSAFFFVTAIGNRYMITRFADFAYLPLILHICQEAKDNDYYLSRPTSLYITSMNLGCIYNVLYFMYMFL